MHTLFIGGPLDGQIVEVDPLRQHIEVAINHPLNVKEPTTPDNITDIFYYKRQVLECPTVELSVFVPRTYSCAQLMAALIEGYHRGATQNQRFQ